MRANSLLVTLIFSLIYQVGFSQDKSKLLTSANNNYVAGNYRKAASVFKKITKKFPAEEDGYLGLGKCNYQLNSYTEAIKSLNEAIAINGKNAYSFYYRSLVLNKTKKYQDAMNDLSLALQHNTNDTLLFDIYFLRGSIHNTLGEFNIGIEDDIKALGFDSMAIDVMLDLGIAYSNSGNNESALQWFRKVITVDSSDFVFYQNIGFVLSEMERYDEALLYFDKAIQLDPKQAYPYNNRGYVKMKLKDLFGAMSDIDQSIKINSGNAYAYRNRALVYLEMKDPLRACNDLEKARKLGYKNAKGNDVEVLINSNCK